MSGSVVLGGARTPIGRLSGALASRSAVDLGGVAIAAALDRAGIAPADVDRVVVGQVLGAGQGQMSGRQAAVLAGIALTVPALNVNKVCLSGMAALHVADLMISSGEADIVVVAGIESMTNAPHLLPGVRSGYRFGGGEVVDSILADGLVCAFDCIPMGEATDRYAGAAGIARTRQDEIALRSHTLTAKAVARGRLASEIAPVPIVGRGGTTFVEGDEGVRADTTTEKLAQLRPAFVDQGSVTAGNSSQLSDGAAALIVASSRFASEHSLTPIGEVVGHGSVAGPDPSLLTQPSRAARATLGHSGIAVADVDVWEINEAFAAVVAASVDDLDVSIDQVNVNGGAIALGHPIGMSGVRLVLTLLEELRDRSASIGVAALCGGGGQGEAVVVRAIG